MQKIVIFTGKGGVGKSTLAAAYALQQASEGRRTLLVELGVQSYFQYVFKRPISYKPVTLEPNLSVAIWSGETCLREYVLYLLKIEKIVDLFFNNRIMKTFISAAPALKELAIIGKITSGVRNWGPPMPYDVIVVDGYSTGHFLALLKAPIGMAELIEKGPMGEHSRRMIEVIKNSACTQYFICTLPEELPTAEALELRDDLHKIVGHEAKIICNKVYNSNLDDRELKQLAEIKNQGGRFAKFLMDLQIHQSTYLNILQKADGCYRTTPLVLKPDSLEVIQEVRRHLQ